MDDASTWARARSPAQKRAREEEVLDAAARLLSTRPFASISLSDLAGEVSFSRANLYKYFGSKEEVYLALMARSAERFARSITRALAEDAAARRIVPGTSGAAKVMARLWIRELASRGELLQLMSMAGTVLERSCSDEAIITAKTRMAAGVTEHLLPFVGAFFPELDVDRGVALIQFLIVTANGLFPMCGLDGRQRALLRDHGLAGMVMEFEPVYAQLVASRFDALIAEV